MVVIALIAVATAVASLALRDPASTALEREAARLAALLESARAEARASGVAAWWEPRTLDNGQAVFQFVGLPAAMDLPGTWLEAGTSAEVVGTRRVVLGPEPLIGAQRILLRLGDRRLVLATDGIGPFAVAADVTTAAN
jgi:general secretion pathway protein H